MEIALFRPEIPPNTGNIARLSVCTGSRLHIIGQPSFSLAESRVRRAGIDYWNEVDLTLHSGWESFRLETKRQKKQERTIVLFTRFADNCYADHRFKTDDILVFGRETSGLPAEIIEEIAGKYPARILRLPVQQRCRSLNLANAVAIVLYEGLRQLDFPEMNKGYR